MIIATSLFATASYHNYPGGVALSRLLHQHIPSHYPTAKGSVINIHMDVYACMTGVTRFLQEVGPNQSIVFDKNESLIDSHDASHPSVFAAYDFLITEDSSSDGKNHEFEVIDKVQIFDSFTLNLVELRRGENPVQVRTRDALYLMKNKKLK